MRFERSCYEKKTENESLCVLYFVPDSIFVSVGTFKNYFLDLLYK